MMKNLSKMLLIIAMVTSNSCHALVVMAAKRTQTVRFNFGVMPKYIARRTTWTSSFQEIFDAAFLIGPNNESLIVPGTAAFLPANQDKARSFLDGVVVNFENAAGLQRDPSKSAYEGALFGANAANLSRRAFIPMKENTVESNPVEHLMNFSHCALEFFAGLSYSFHEHFGVWCRGGYVFPINLFKSQDEDKIQNLNYSIKEIIDSVDSAQAGQKMSVGVVGYAYGRFQNRMLSKATLTLSVREGFSLSGGVVFSPFESCSVELGLGIRQYTAKATWSDGEVSIPHGRQYTDAYLRNTVHPTFLEKMTPVEVCQSAYPILLHFGFIYTMERFHVGFSLDYSSFSVDLNADNTENKTSGHVKSFAGAVRTYGQSATPALAGLADVRGFSMTHLNQLSGRFAVKSSVRDISVGIRVGVTF